jgi:hypothetical protein
VLETLVQQIETAFQRAGCQGQKELKWREPIINAPPFATMAVMLLKEKEEVNPFPPPDLATPSPSTWKEKVADAAVLCKAVYQIKVKNRDAVLNRQYEQPVGKFDFLPLPKEYQTCVQRLVLARSSHGHIIVSLRGTKTLRDIVTDFSIRQQPLDCVAQACSKDEEAEGAMAHRGFWARAKVH